MTRIKDTGTTATSPASDDYVLIDGATNGSRKLPAGNLGGLALISRTTTSGSASNVTFSSIPGTFTDLIVEVSGRSDKSGTTYDDLRMQLNADTGSNYDYNHLQINNTSVSGVAGAASAFFFVGFLTGATAPTNVGCSTQIILPNYAGTTFQKNVDYKSQLNQSNAVSGLWQINGSGWYRSTSAITSVKVYPATSNFVNGSVVSLWGRA